MRSHDTVVLDRDIENPCILKGRRVRARVERNDGRARRHAGHGNVALRDVAVLANQYLDLNLDFLVLKLEVP